jgi:MFS family permease
MQTERPRLSLRIVMLTSGIPATLCFTAISPILPKMEAALAQGPGDAFLVKMVLAVVGLAMVFGSPLAGWLADKMSRVTLMAIAMLVWAVFGCMGYLIAELHVMVASRLVVGLAAATALTVGLTMIGDLADPALRLKYMGVQVAISTITSIITSPIAGVIGDIYWRLPFLLYAISLPLALVAWSLRGNEPARAVAGASDAPGLGADAKFRFPFGLMFLGLCCGTITFAPVTYMPFHFRDLGVDQAKIIAIALSAETVAIAIMASQYGRARQYLSTESVFTISFLLSGAGLGIAAIATDWRVAAFGLLVFGFGVGWFAANVVARASAFSAPQSRGRTVGLVKGAHLFASFLAVLALEPVGRAGGPPAVLLVLTALAWLIALYFATRIYGGKGRTPLAVAENAA